MFNNRQEDLSKVFDKTWKANHNDVAKKGRERGPRGMVVLWNVKYLLRVKKKLVKQEVILRNF